MPTSKATDLDNIAGQGEYAGTALAVQLKRVGRLSPGVDAEPDVAEHIRILRSSVFKFALLNGATQDAATTAADTYASALVAALRLGFESPSTVLAVKS